MYDESADFEQHAAEVRDANAVFARLAVASNGAERVLDLGGGQGMHVSFLQGVDSKFYCAGILAYSSLYDSRLISEFRSKRARNGVDFDVDRAAFISTDAMSLLFRDECFDRIYSFNVVEHTPDPCKAFKEIVRLLKSGGFACISMDPIWTCDTGSHFSAYGAEPWAHLALSVDAFRERIRKNGASEAEVAAFPGDMNRHREAFLLECVQGLDPKHVEVIFSDVYRGTAGQDGEDHSSFAAALALGYSGDDLLLLRMRWVLRKKAAAR